MFGGIYLEKSFDLRILRNVIMTAMFPQQNLQDVYIANSWDKPKHVRAVTMFPLQTMKQWIETCNVPIVSIRKCEIQARSNVFSNGFFPIVKNSLIPGRFPTCPFGTRSRLPPMTCTVQVDWLKYVNKRPRYEREISYALYRKTMGRSRRNE